MNNNYDCVEVPYRDFDIILKKMKKDGKAVINIKDEFYDRFSPTLFIGRLQGSRAYMNPLKFNSYRESLGGQK